MTFMINNRVKPVNPWDLVLHISIAQPTHMDLLQFTTLWGLKFAKILIVFVASALVRIFVRLLISNIRLTRLDVCRVFGWGQNLNHMPITK